MRRKLKSQISNIKSSRIFLYVLIFILSCVMVFIFFKQLSASLFFIKKDRINVVYYGKNTIFYSLGKYDGVHYFISFYPDVKVKVPGGYGSYRVGALGKMIVLEKKSDLIRKAFSATIASTVDKYYYRSSQEIYYGKEELDETSFGFPSFGDIFFSPSNSNIFDRIFIFLKFVGKQKRQFEKIEYKSYIGVEEEFFQDKDFAKKYQGFLYNRIYRKEQKTVQIIYHRSYNTALLISKIIEGDGIRVVDLSENTKEGTERSCKIIEQGDRFSQSAIDMAAFFTCKLSHGRTESSDIIIQLGIAEKEWEIL
ncbi:hypothetical protein A2334_03285 [Candidatus Roizmanbacteria bacterium RIFOXYB2_FULL_38_10]|uniref:LytR/CpsA/Psr regulator C-terminal domain-containing protein n=1 Tax=Candidatus Roizmanbacteria bacterium RIFOXYD1_FULL_38_12 TaxID=1802093 RepID=A0A1F7L129_9BACT|nr:MAG: hypothetical protein A3K47_03565 [Candidatus Roizmanbacteria bacterium RIFOXYA2_FULL_38_14]OGK63840.1 MAG: hypothetical protein A3K27_03565 [Candidatus Roizmanbacteria bacterium RIFOXYA1_FULL_37_12]OGK65686.1 MAG: hypothetical protein A3K38_03565 [Candidatus Roizmanbacteria bacterium RIFOXYB1_FULL_40_23]OGK67427.1 MAG: hypothetical protein A2334_03285 [Candidatus Roizmanbacteria bacterium RIFOXYB2_FULL_38_10]OGK70091.1 MAG: hypothetical protein A3K21_03570 [Candidatus Roizmanbacteria ba